MLLSVVVPCYNEEAVIDETHRRLCAVVERIEDLHFELVYVDDGSHDRTADILARLQDTDPHVRVLRLSRNFGHQTAITAGVAHASGHAVVIIDADLQDPPELIPQFVARWREGYDVVYGVRTKREGESRFKRWTAAAFYRLINRLSEVQIPIDTGDFRLIDRRVVDALLAMPESARFVRGMVAWIGFRQIAVPYQRAAREAGETKYPFVKMMRFALDAVSSFSIAPLRLATWTGFAASALAVLGILYALITRLFTNIWVTGWTALIIAVLFMGGVQLIALGIIGEYVGRVYGEAKLRPLYLVADRLGFASEAAYQTPVAAGTRRAGRREVRVPGAGGYASTVPPIADAPAGAPRMA